MKNSGTHTQYTAVERNNQLVLILNSEIKLPEDAPVRVTSAQLEELDYRKLYAAYSSRGRKSVTDPRVIFKVMAYGYQCGIFSSQKLEEACQYRVDFMWLPENQKAPDHATFFRFRTGRCSEAVEDLFIAANSEYITGIEAFSNRTDVGTFIPFMRKLELAHQRRYEEVITDAGYESLDNYLYLEANGQMSFIKPTNYEAQKTKKFRDQIGRIENMKYDQDEDCFICAEGRKLHCRKESTLMQDGIPVTRAWYRCESCENCPQRERCCRKQDINAPKEVIWKKTFREKREVSLQNITCDRGIMLRMNRSILVEGAFGLLKNDFSFRRFMTTGKRNIRIELFFLALGFNLKKRWMKQQKSRLETHYSEKKAS